MDLFQAAENYQLTQWLFLRAMALVYFAAFWSLDKQVLGLFGSRGILPFNNLPSSPESRKRFPSIFWKNHSDLTLQLGTFAGTVFSFLAFIGIYPAFFFLILYVLYLSYHSLGSVFLSYQWDVLLLESGILTILFAVQSPPPQLLVYLLWFFLFRFMLSSGLVKILSRCPSWATFSAMDFHYSTQPLPNKTAFYMHQHPGWFRKLSQGVVYFVEIVTPFLIFTPMPIRFVVFLILVAFQLVIFATGNYAFFNLLTIALCIPLLNDSYLPFGWSGVAFPDTLWTAVPLTFAALVLIYLNAVQFAELFIEPGRAGFLNALLTPFRVVNQYGLFAMMTTVRNEIILEGSNDGVEWKPYEFYYKPGDLKKAPLQVAPHQPRLDWQMWFASLNHYRNEYWFACFLERLLEGSPDVLKLIKSNPFPEKPPRFIRAQFYRYHFNDLKSFRETGEWWVRTYVGMYAPTVRRNDKMGKIVKK